MRRVGRLDLGRKIKVLIAASFLTFHQFDDLPQFSPPNNDTAPAPPIFNPHDLLYFSDCWSYVPPPTDPYPPQNGSHLAECAVNQSSINTIGGGSFQEGSFGAGPRAGLDAFWLNAASAYVGCDNSNATVDCDFTVRGYRWMNDTQTEMLHESITVPIHGCQGLKGCQLQYADFGDSFTGVSTLGFSAYVRGKPVSWFIDTIALSWWNNSCSAGLLRSKARF